MKNSSKNILTVIIIFIVLIIIGVACNNINRQSAQSEKQKFTDQMKQNPNTWNKEQKDRYNDFMDWTEKQNNK